MPAKRKRRSDGRFATTVTAVNPVNGQKQLKYVYGKTQKELKENALKASKAFYNDGITFKTFSEDWYKRQKSGVSDNTHRMYETAFNRLSCLNSRKLGNITVSDIQTLISDLSDTPNQANKVLSTLDQIFKDADALDRFRLGSDGLDIKYLRTDVSKSLYDFAKKVWGQYEQMMEDVRKTIRVN